MSVLVIGSVSDPHITHVCSHLRSMGEAYDVFDAELGFSTGHVSITYESNGIRGHLQCKHSTIELDGIDSVFFRVKPSFRFVERHIDWFQKTFIDREWSQVFDGLSNCLANDALWVNPRRSDCPGRNKPQQLHLATRLGLAIPKTLITNNSTEAVDFLDSLGGHGIFKSLSWFFRPPNTMLYTTHVTSAMIADMPSSLKLAPSIFQERIDKAFELRVTIVGVDLFAAKIHSQASREAALDWRREIDTVLHEPFVLPEAMASRLLSLHSRLGLIFGAYDLIVTPSGDYVFLEVNPAGQYLWIEERLGFPITARLAALLARR